MPIFKLLEMRDTHSLLFHRFATAAVAAAVILIPVIFFVHLQSHRFKILCKEIMRRNCRILPEANATNDFIVGFSRSRLCVKEKRKQRH